MNKLAVLAWITIAAAQGAQKPGPPTGLMCELMERGELTFITDPRPEFSWIVNDGRRGAAQGAYRIILASDRKGAVDGRGDVGDSGRTASSRSVNVEYAGAPLEPNRPYFWRVMTWDGVGVAGPWSEVKQFRTGVFGGEAPLPPPSTKDWVWIWGPGEPVEGVVKFRRAFDLPPKVRVRQATFHLTVDDNFDLLVNDKKLASTGREPNAWKTIRRVDVTRALVPGRNALSIAAFNKGDAAGATGALEIETSDGKHTTIRLDGSWSFGTEKKSARVLGPYGMKPWGTTAQMPGGSRASEALSDGYPLVKTEVQPARVVKVGAGHWFIDFGRAAFATVRFKAESREAGREVEVHLGEVAEGDQINRKPGGSRRYRKMTQKLKSGSHTYEVKITPDRRNTGGQAIKIPSGVGEVMPFRYCELVGYPGTLEAAKIVQIAVHYPFDDKGASFTSSNETLNRVWELCRYSIKATSFAGLYVDGDRERIPYEADAYINQLCHYGVDREYTMARRSLEYLIVHPTWPVEWQHHIVLMAWEDFLYTGNDELLRANYDNLAAKTLFALAREDGLIVIEKKRMTPEFKKSIHFGKELRTLVDWPAGERDGHKIKPVDAVVNAFYYETLLLMERIARALGKEKDARGWSQRAARVAEAYQRAFFDASRGIYLDGEAAGHSSLHSNMFPLAFGLVPEKRRGKVMAFVKSRGMACSVYASQYLLDGLYEARQADYALSLLTSTSKRSWFNMIREGSTVSMEAWDNRFKPNQDWNHAWGAAPANLIPRRLMGIRPLEPGFRRFIVEPQIASLTHASIKAPSIRGPVELELRRDGDSCSLRLKVPANTTAVVSLPASDPSGVTESRVSLERAPKVRLKGVEGGRTIVEAPGGEYQFRIP